MLFDNLFLLPRNSLHGRMVTKYDLLPVTSSFPVFLNRADTTTQSILVYYEFSKKSKFITNIMKFNLSIILRIFSSYPNFVASVGCQVTLIDRSNY